MIFVSTSLFHTFQSGPYILLPPLLSLEDPNLDLSLDLQTFFSGTSIWTHLQTLPGELTALTFANDTQKGVWQNALSFLSAFPFHLKCMIT